MNRLRNIFMVGCILVFSASCAVISSDLRKEATPFASFRTLIEEVDAYKGRTVILGGYILETRNLANETLLIVLQSPLKAGEMPASREQSEGRFILSHPGFLDPAIFEKDREITAAGVVLGLQMEKIDEIDYAYLKLQSREIYFWQEEAGPREPCYDPWCHSWHGRPYWRRPCWP
ncbi:MAG: starvation-inducible protein [Desulfobacterales bacterium]|nr:starvation-inducible protein [Desulfobacterales bacterium]